MLAHQRWRERDSSAGPGGPGLPALTAASGLHGLGGRAQIAALAWFKIYLKSSFYC